MTEARRLLLLLTGINLVNYMDRYVVAAVLEPLGRELHLSNAQLGRLTFVFIAVYMCSAPLFGSLADRFHRPRLVAAGVALWSLATVGAAFVHSYPGLLVMRSLVGVGEAAYASLGPTMLADGFHESDRARNFTWFYLAIPVGSALGYGMGGMVAGAWGWRASFLVAGLPGLAFALWMAFQADPQRGGMDSAQDVDAGTPYLHRLRHVFFNRVWLACTASYIAYTFAMGGLSTWGPTLLQRRYGISTSRAGLVFGALAVVTGILGTFLGGWVTDRWQHRWPNAGIGLSAVTLLLAAPVVAWALGTHHLGTTYALFFLGMFLLFVNTSPVNALVVSSLPSSIRATGVAVNVLLIHLFGDAISPELVGRRADALVHLGLGGGDALGQALTLVVPAIVLSALALAWARFRTPQAT